MNDLFKMLAATEEDEPQRDSIFDPEDFDFGIEEDVQDDPDGTVEPDPEPEDNESLEIEIDGEKFTLDDVLEWKRGNMRTSDYTRKTQEVKTEREQLQREAAQNREAVNLFQTIQANPDLIKIINDYASTAELVIPGVNSQPQQQQPNYDPRVDDLLRQTFIEKTEAQLKEILAENTGVTDVELLSLAESMKTDVKTAYEVWKGRNVDKIVNKKLQTEKLKINDEIKNNKNSTISLINKAQKKKPQQSVLSDSKMDAAKALGMSAEEYAKWDNYNPNR